MNILTPPETLLGAPGPSAYTMDHADAEQTSSKETVHTIANGLADIHIAVSGKFCCPSGTIVMYVNKQV